MEPHYVYLIMDTYIPIPPTYLKIFFHSQYYLLINKLHNKSKIASHGNTAVKEK